MTDTLAHYGTPRHSGRYPWGSGEAPHQNNKSLLIRIRELEAQGLTQTQVAAGLGMSTTQYRAVKSIAKNEERKENQTKAFKLKEKGYSTSAIGRELGIPEPTVRNMLKVDQDRKADKATKAAALIKEMVDEKGLVDIGLGAENYMDLSKEQLAISVEMLKSQGYKDHEIKTPQLGNPGKFTRVKVLAPPDMPYSEVYANRDKIHIINAQYNESASAYSKPGPPKPILSKRVQIRYAEEGGADKDGVVELRRGVSELSLGGKRYGQVRIAVDGDKYMKGMAIYADKMPDGIDIIYNSNKPKGTPPEKVFKPMEKDPDMPFGSVVRQKFFRDADGKEQQSLINMVGGKGEGNVEGTWGEWSKTLSSQMLSKQKPELAKTQLGLSHDIKKDAFEEIKGLTNPVIKKKLLESFADECDSDAVHLKAAALPGQRTHVILPIPSMKENEVYAPNYNNGDRVVLIRHPHGGPFEIPELTVNNRQREAIKVMGGAEDGVGIHPKVAAKLSGADFDGDTVLVIPNNDQRTTRKVISAPSLKDLEGFEPKTAYREREGMKVMTEGGKGKEMGDISNLITDMTIKGATNEELARAVKHSMVVIDAVKHRLDYKRSADENGIIALKQKYQPKPGGYGGASTLISRSKSELRLPERKERSYPDGGPIDPATGKKMYTPTGLTYTITTKTGKVVTKPRLTKTTKMAEADDAFDLSSGTRMEGIYANYANSLKAMGNEARKIMLATPPMKYNADANKVYSKEVSSLKAKLNIAIKNAPLERRAQLIAGSAIAAKKRANPHMDSDDLKKLSMQELNEARLRTRAERQQIFIDDDEWKAIQAGAISNNMLSNILDRADQDRFKALATPRTAVGMTPAKISRARSMLNLGHTAAEVASILGVSVSTIHNNID